MKKSLLLFFILVFGLQKSFAQTTPFIYTDTVDPIINLNFTNEEENAYYASPNYDVLPVSRTITVPFRTSGIFNPGNQFKVMLSDTLGAFGSGISRVIATLSASGNVGNRTVNAVIPFTDLWSTNKYAPPVIESGRKYRIRVESTDPVVIGSPNAASISLGTSNIIIGGIQEHIPAITNGDLKIMLDWIHKKMLYKDIDFCYKDTKTREPAAAPNSFPQSCGNGLVKYGDFCYNACADNYSNVVGVCWESCRSGWIDGGIFCYPSYSTVSTPSLVGNCPSEYDNTGIECYRWFRSDYHPSQMASCPSGYTNMGLTCYRPWSIPIDDFPLSDSRATCPSGYFKGFAGRCYYNCGPGWNNDGDFCSRPASSISYANGMYCPAGYEPLSDFAFGRCYQRCEQGWSSTLEFCQLNELSRLKGSYVLTPYPLQCNTGYEVQYVPFPLCYPKCETSYVGVGPVCWTKCDPLYECGPAACAKDETSCALAITDMVVSTVMLVKSVIICVLTVAATATGVLAPAGQALNAAGKGIDVITKYGIKTLKVNANTSKLGKAMIQAASKIQQIYTEGYKATGAIKPILPALSSGEKVIQFIVTKAPMAYAGGKLVLTGVNESDRLLSAGITVGKDFFIAARAYKTELAKHFIDVTNADINDKIDRNFPEGIANYIKESYATQKLGADVETWMGQYASYALTALSMGLSLVPDPTGVFSVICGVADVVNAFLKPPCKRPADFPTLSKNYLLP
jgi:hypothetical protein